MPDTIKFVVHLLQAVASLKYDACADVTRGIPSTRSKWQLLATRPAVTHYGVCTSSPAKHHSPNLASKLKVKSTEHFIKKSSFDISCFYFDLFEFCLFDKTCFEKASFFNRIVSQEGKKRPPPKKCVKYSTYNLNDWIKNKITSCDYKLQAIIYMLRDM